MDKYEELKALLIAQDEDCLLALESAAADLIVGMSSDVAASRAEVECINEHHNTYSANAVRELAAAQSEVDRLTKQAGHYENNLERLAGELVASQSEVERLKAVLGQYAHNGCEGWCKDAPANAFFEDCGGCPARKALDAKP